MPIANFSTRKVHLAIVQFPHPDRILNCHLNHPLLTTIAIKDGKNKVNIAYTFLNFFQQLTNIFQKMNSSYETQSGVTTSNLSMTTAVVMSE